MNWTDFLGNRELIERFGEILARGRLASTYLFVGPPGVGKSTFARLLCQSLFCERTSPDSLDFCGSCSSCQQLVAGTHPDFHPIRRPADKSALPVELFIGSREHRMQEGLCFDISRRPFSADRKFALIDDADDLNEEGANSLLKTLEEPPPRSVLILVGTNLHRQLPTIRSRSQIVRFQPLSDQELDQLLAADPEFEDASLRNAALAWGQGSLTWAREAMDESLIEFRTALLPMLIDPNAASVDVANLIGQFADAAGMEAPQKRIRLRQVAQILITVYQAAMRASQALPPADPRIDADIATGLGKRFRDDTERLSRRITRSIQALTQINANAHPATLIASFVDDLYHAP